jgi:4-amino-4-deoxy-L-arabinose transferase-like glycosyltransferase
MSRQHRLAALIVGVLALAAFNLTFRIDSESLTEWDESLYASSALDMLSGGNLAATTILGELDYYNTKPPLNVWLIAGSMRLFGHNLFAVRLPAIAAAWLTVLVVVVWGWRRLGPVAALFAALVLATSFGFLHVHSGRSANPDAPLTLFFLLIVVVLDLAAERPWLRVWLGPLLAGVFFLKGFAVVLPLVFIAIIEARRRVPPAERWVPLATAAAFALCPILAWGIARWQVDRAVFFKQMFLQDFVSLSTMRLDDHGGPPSYYLNVLLKHHYDWLFAAIAVGVLYPPHRWRAWLRRLAFWRASDSFVCVVGWWSIVALIVPSMMQTKLPWYVNPIYPVFALGVGAALSYGFARTDPAGHRKFLVAMVLMAAVVAESKLLVYSYRFREVDDTLQGVLIAEAPRIAGAQIFSVNWLPLSDTFVIRGLVKAEHSGTITVEDFLARTGSRDFIVLPTSFVHPALVRVLAKGEFALYRRADPPGSL